MHQNQNRFFRLAARALVALLPVGVLAQCTLDCRMVPNIGGVFTGTPFCYNFSQPTARNLYKNEGLTGKVVVQVENCSQTAESWDACPAICPIYQIPQQVNIGGNLLGTLTYGCYECGPADPGNGEGGL